jgi:hypothetical protein
MFEPERFLKPNIREDIDGWAGFDPSRGQGSLYPNEVCRMDILSKIKVSYSHAP